MKRKIHWSGSHIALAAVLGLTACASMHGANVSQVPAQEAQRPPGEGWTCFGYEADQQLTSHCSRTADACEAVREGVVGKGLQSVDSCSEAELSWCYHAENELFSDDRCFRDQGQCERAQSSLLEARGGPPTTVTTCRSWS